MTSLEETRSLNIARNNDFLKSLFGDMGVKSPIAALVANPTPAEIAPSAIKAGTLRANKAHERVKRDLLSIFPHRKNEIDELCGYVNEVCGATSFSLSYFYFNVDI